MAKIVLNPALVTTIDFVCSLAINWSAGRKHGDVITVSDSGSTASTPPKISGTIPAKTFQSGDLLEWGVDVFGPTGPASSYTLKVSVSQAGVALASTEQKGSVDGGAAQIEQGTWTVA